MSGLTRKIKYGGTLLLLLAFAAALVYVLPALRDGRIHVTVVVKSLEKSMEFWQVLSDGVETAGKEFGVDVAITGPSQESDIDGQIAVLRQAIAKRPDAIVMAATDYNRLAPVADDIVKAGIRLIMIDSAVNSRAAVSFIATDNIEAGRKAGDEMARLAGGGKIAIISYVQGTATQIDRERGVRMRLEKEPGTAIVGTFYSDGVEQKAYETTKRLLLEVPDLRGIVALNETSTVGAGRAVQELGLAGKVHLVGFDSSLDEVKLLESGVMQATVVQKPFNMGYLGVRTAVEAVRGRKVPERIDTGSVVIDKSNMYSNENQKLLFPFVGK
ncbi:LacI family transcriptional regulator [Gordoniibacillus kamchatkensis]|uniref:LacI family transcriptional regulator n=1 Tax=Gordoniibacillus kamchatkensis TaxID=1590651 RepID=A0ABR5AK11_9BACL|nr:substrate-binding domain-containing protein [Paenibacillus sp. VKM B-2647]KIL41300.1 LacI family transcriptional regulator [Paenibacillus sp. VKM B-2647]